MLAEVLLNGDVAQIAPVDNGTATLVFGATASQRYFVGGIEAHYSAAVAASRNIVVTRTVKGVLVTLTYLWDFTRGPFVHNFPLLIHGDYGTQISVALDASGSPGILGQVAAWVARV